MHRPQFTFSYRCIVLRMIEHNNYSVLVLESVTYLKNAYHNKIKKKLQETTLHTSNTFS